jgi:hypothetical protein
MGAGDLEHGSFSTGYFSRSNLRGHQPADSLFVSLRLDFPERVALSADAWRFQADVDKENAGAEATPAFLMTSMIEFP